MITIKKLEELKLRCKTCRGTGNLFELKIGRNAEPIILCKNSLTDLMKSIYRALEAAND